MSGGVDVGDMGIGAAEAIDEEADHFVRGPRKQEAARGEEHGGGDDHIAVLDGEEPGRGHSQASRLGDEVRKEAKEVAILGLAEDEETAHTLIEQVGVRVFHDAHRTELNGQQERHPTNSGTTGQVGHNLKRGQEPRPLSVTSCDLPIG